MRAIRIRPEVIPSIAVRFVNIVLERLTPLADDERFDLIIATNVLVYYNVFEQSLALANIASMLRPSGLLLSNNVLVELPTTPDACNRRQPGDLFRSSRRQRRHRHCSSGSDTVNSHLQNSNAQTPPPHPCKVGIGKASYDLNTRESGISRPGRSGVVSNVVAVG